MLTLLLYSCIHWVLISPNTSKWALPSGIRAYSSVILEITQKAAVLCEDVPLKRSESKSLHANTAWSSLVSLAFLLTQTSAFKHLFLADPSLWSPDIYCGFPYGREVPYQWSEKERGENFVIYSVKSLLSYPDCTGHKLFTASTCQIHPCQRAN